MLYSLLLTLSTCSAPPELVDSIKKGWEEIRKSNDRLLFSWETQFYASKKYIELTQLFSDDELENVEMKENHLQSSSKFSICGEKFFYETNRPQFFYDEKRFTTDSYLYYYNGISTKKYRFQSDNIEDAPFVFDDPGLIVMTWMSPDIHGLLLATQIGSISYLENLMPNKETEIVKSTDPGDIGIYKYEITIRHYRLMIKLDANNNFRIVSYQRIGDNRLEEINFLYEGSSVKNWKTKVYRNKSLFSSWNCTLKSNDKSDIACDFKLTPKPGTFLVSQSVPPKIDVILENGKTSPLTQDDVGKSYTQIIASKNRQTTSKYYVFLVVLLILAVLPLVFRKLSHSRMKAKK